MCIDMRIDMCIHMYRYNNTYTLWTMKAGSSLIIYTYVHTRIRAPILHVMHASGSACKYIHARMHVFTWTHTGVILALLKLRRLVCWTT